MRRGSDTTMGDQKTSKASFSRRLLAKPAGTGRHWCDAFLKLIARGKSRVELRKNGIVYGQGQQADAVFFVEQGKVRLSVRSKVGQEAILGTLAPGEFCGEGCLSGQPLRIGSATALTAATVIKVEKAALVQALKDHHPLSEAFLAQLLARNISFEEDICDQLFNHSEKRLARALLKLARFGQETAKTHGHSIAPGISQEALAEMIGVTHSRVAFFMNKFRRLGLIDFTGKTSHGRINVHPELLTDVVLSD